MTYAFERLAIIAIVAVLACAITLMIAAISPSTSDGERHVGPIPENIMRLTHDKYFLAGGSAADNIALDDLCLGEDGNGESVEAMTAIPGHGTFVDCTKDQRWNQGPAARDISYWEALVQTAQKPLYLVLVGIGLLAIVGGLLATIPSFISARQGRRAVLAGAEQKRRELVAAYARDEIMDHEYERGLNRVYELGVKPAKD